MATGLAATGLFRLHLEESNMHADQSMEGAKACKLRVSDFLSAYEVYVFESLGHLNAPGIQLVSWVARDPPSQ